MDNLISDQTKLYYTIGEVAALFSVNTSLIRYYENEFDVIKPHKNKKGNRLFTRKDLEYFRRIFDLVKEEGLTLSEVKAAIVSVEKKETSSDQEVIKRLRKIRKMLEELSSQVDADQ
jgi:DNA-binding transcriptional MerR regulator